MRIGALFFLCILLASCSSSDGVEVDEADMGYDFVPLLSVGDVREYVIEQSIYSNDGRDIEGRSIYQKEEVVESSGALGQSGSYRMDVFQKESVNDAFEYIYSYNVEFNPIQVIKDEFGDRIIHLSFPALEGKTWDGLIFTDDNQTRIIGDKGIQYYNNWDFRVLTHDGNHADYQDVLEVQLADSENAIERRYNIEKYAKNIGLVYREMMILDTQCTAGCPDAWEEKAYNGIVYRKELINYN